jgi:hypothetical protein
VCNSHTIPCLSDAALLTTTNASAVVLWRDGAVQCARGTLTSDPNKPAADNLRKLTAALGTAAVSVIRSTSDAQVRPRLGFLQKHTTRH